MRARLQDGVVVTPNDSPHVTLPFLWYLAIPIVFVEQALHNVIGLVHSRTYRNQGLTARHRVQQTRSGVPRSVP